MCPDWESNPQPSGLRDDSQPTEPHQPALKLRILVWFLSSAVNGRLFACCCWWRGFRPSQMCCLVVYFDISISFNLTHSCWFIPVESYLQIRPHFNPVFWTLPVQMNLKLTWKEIKKYLFIVFFTVLFPAKISLFCQFPSKYARLAFNHCSWWFQAVIVGIS